ncbi:hypothetical protein [Rhodococcus rhodnii]|uniref:hypothetical protein n=1 Tax=Rhodococcus rhodnii TaxID=38312 RepID=UPI0009DBA0F3
MPTVDEPDFAHTDRAAQSRLAKARALAGFAWDRGIDSAEVLAFTDAVARKFARAAGVNPPGSGETWRVVAGLLDEKAQWALRNPDHPAAARAHRDEKIMWVKPPITPW